MRSKRKASRPDRELRKRKEQHEKIKSSHNHNEEGTSDLVYEGGKNSKGRPAGNL